MPNMIGQADYRGRLERRLLKHVVVRPTLMSSRVSVTLLLMLYDSNNFTGVLVWNTKMSYAVSNSYLCFVQCGMFMNKHTFVLIASCCNDVALASPINVTGQSRRCPQTRCHHGSGLEERPRL